MEEKRFVWKAGSQFPVSAQVAADTIKNLATSLNKDTVTAKELLDASRPDDAPPHLARSRYFINVVPVTPKAQGQFTTVDIAFSNDNYRNAVLKDALRELRAFQIKYSRYQELSDIFKAIVAARQSSADTVWSHDSDFYSKGGLQMLIERRCSARRTKLPNQ